MNERMNKRAVFDIESNHWIDFLVLGFFDGIEFRTFSTIKLFLQHLEKRKFDNFTVYAHNGGKFDFLFLLQDVFALGWKPEFIERGGRIIAMKCRTRHNIISFADSYALLPASLDSLGKNFDVEHKKSKFEFKENMKVTKKLLSYLENDCLCLYEVLEKFFNSQFVENPKLTIASQSLDTFKNRYLPDGAEIFKMKLKDEDFFREKFYAGGRVEVFKGYGTGINVYDVNSLYPASMLNEMPIGEYSVTRSYHKDKIGFYHVEMNFPESEYLTPLLVKYQKGSFRKNFFVTGKGQYYLSSFALEMIRRNFGIRFKVLRGYVFKKRGYLFNDFVNDFYKIKSETKDQTEKYIAKLFLNSLYGKFGQSRFNETVQMYNSELIDFSPFNEKFGLVLTTNESKSGFILPYLASYITDIARTLHFEMMLQAGNSVYYCDTDSIFTTKKLPVKNEIGGLHFEGTYEGIFIGSKMYALKNPKEQKVKFKGFDTKEFTFTDFKNHLLKGKELTQTKERILSFRECFTVTDERLIRRNSDFLKMVSTTKKATGEYDKRKIIPSKKHVFETKPFTFTEINER